LHFKEKLKWDYVLFAHICARIGHPMKNSLRFVVAAAVLSFATLLSFAAPINPFPQPKPHAAFAAPINPFPQPKPHVQ
jgi:hypothetical protein